MLKDYSTPETHWILIGRTPMTRVRVPLGLLRWQVSKPGFATVYEAHTSMRDGGRITFELQPEGLIPARMVRVPGGPIGFTVAGLGNVGGFDAEPYFIDKYEVTNRALQGVHGQRRLQPAGVLETAVHRGLVSLSTPIDNHYKSE